MNRLTNLIFTHTRSIQVLQYTHKTIYEIPLLYGETVSKAKPEVFISPHCVKIEFPNRWIESQPSQKQCISSTNSQILPSHEDSTTSSRLC